MTDPEKARVAARWALFAFSLSSVCVLILVLNAILGNPWGLTAVFVAAAFLVAAGVVGFQARRLYFKNRR